MKKYKNFINENWNQAHIKNWNYNFRLTKTYDTTKYTLHKLIDLIKTSGKNNGDLIEYMVRNVKYDVYDSFVLLRMIIRYLKNYDSEYTLISYPAVEILVNRIKNIFKLSELLRESVINNRYVVVQMLINAGADVNFKYAEKPIIFECIYQESYDSLEVLLNSENIKTDIIYEGETLLTLAVKEFFSYSKFEILLDENIDWTHKSYLYGKSKTFIEMLDNDIIEQIKENYPNKYEEYITSMNIEIFNI